MHDFTAIGMWQISVWRIIYSAACALFNVSRPLIFVCFDGYVYLMNMINELKEHNVFLIPVMSGIDAYRIHRS